MEWLQSVATIVTSPAFIILALVLLIVVANRVGYEVEFLPEKKLPRIVTRKQRDMAQARMALSQLTEVGKGLRGVVESAEAQVDAALQRWFESLCDNVAWTLVTDKHEVYRVAIWTKDRDDDDKLIALAWHLMPDHDDNWKTLSKSTSLAGKAMTTRQPYYCADVFTDPEYVRRNQDDPDPNYASVYALPLGDGEPWGAMTISAKAKDGFTEQDRQIAVQFGALASIGAAVGLALRRVRDAGRLDNEPDTDQGV